MRTASRRRAGFTLLELTISVTILAILMWIVGTVTDRSKQAFRTSSLQQRADMEARRCVDRIATELSGAVATSLSPNPLNAGGTNQLRFHKIVNVVAGVPVNGNTMWLRLQAEPGENANDGIDNDDDGSIDEMRVTLTQDEGFASEKTSVLCNGVCKLLEGETAAGGDENANGIVNESGLWISRAGQVLTIRLSVQERGRGDKSAVATVETSVRLRE